jgi:hypothetical protein
MTVQEPSPDQSQRNQMSNDPSGFGAPDQDRKRMGAHVGPSEVVPSAPRSGVSSRPYSGGVSATGGSLIDKSVGAALVLTFFFGPFGLFYVTVKGAVIMILLSVVVALVTVGFGLFLLWPIVMVWAAVAASRMHQEFEIWKVQQLAGGGRAQV